MKLNSSNISTILGLIVAVANAWINVDWANFTWDVQHVAPLIVSALVAIGGYMTQIESK